MENTTMTIVTRYCVDAVTPLRSTTRDRGTLGGAPGARGAGQGTGLSYAGGTARVMDGVRPGSAHVIDPSTSFAPSDVVPFLGRPPV